MKTAPLSLPPKVNCIRQVLISTLIVSFFPGALFAHAFAHYASTPITPPAEFCWWWPISMFLLVLGTYFPLRMSLQWSRLFSAFIALIWSLVFTVVFFWLGHQASLMSTAPPPGLGFPCGTYWGRTFSQVGSIFLFWNCFGLFILMSGPVILLYRARKKSDWPKCIAFWSWIIAMPVCFVLGLTPYIVTGAWVHGWGGGYVIGQCQTQVEYLHSVLIMYALDHDNRLPIAKDFEELYPQIRPYLPNETGWRSQFDECVIGKAWDRTPKPFIWNAEFSGKEIFRGGYGGFSDYEISEPLANMFGKQIEITGKPWVICPYNPRGIAWVMIDSQKIEPEKFNRLRKYQGNNAGN